MARCSPLMMAHALLLMRMSVCEVDDTESIHNQTARKGFLMDKRKLGMGLTATAIVIGFAALVFAYDNYGNGHMMGNGGHMMASVMGNGAGHHHGDMGYSDDDGDITQEQADTFKKSVQAFYQETRELRRAIKDKRVAIDNELQKEDPDGSMIIGLQAELSQIEAQFDRKVIEHQLELRKQLPASAFNQAQRGYCW